MDDLIRDMIEPQKAAPHEIARRRRLGATGAIVALAAIGITSLTTNALFTDTDTTSLSGFTTGSVDIATSENVTTITPDEGAAPGDEYFVPVSVENTGSLQLRYSIGFAHTDTNNLGSVLFVTLHEAASSAACTAGTVGDVVAVRRTLDAATTAGTSYVGSRTQGQQAGDRRLASGVSEVLCARFDLPLDTGNAFMDSSATVTLEFPAEQVKNNP